MVQQELNASREFAADSYEDRLRVAKFTPIRIGPVLEQQRH